MTSIFIINVVVSLSCLWLVHVIANLSFVFCFNVLLFGSYRSLKNAYLKIGGVWQSSFFFRFVPKSCPKISCAIAANNQDTWHDSVQEFLPLIWLVLCKNRWGARWMDLSFMRTIIPENQFSTKKTPSIVAKPHFSSRAYCRLKISVTQHGMACPNVTCSCCIILKLGNYMALCNKRGLHLQAL